MWRRALIYKKGAYASFFCFHGRIFSDMINYKIVLIRDMLKGIDMHHFFVDSGDIEENIVHINGENYNHLKNVLRVKPGEKILISDGEGTDYECAVSDIEEDEVVLKILFKEEIHELPGRVYLFQGLPKKDKMELIIEKAVELGAYSIIPVETENPKANIITKMEAVYRSD